MKRQPVSRSVPPLTCVLAALLVSGVGSRALAADLCGELTGRLTVEGSPYSVTCNISVPAFGTLIIDPGVVLKFQSATQLLVYGTLRAQGTSGPSQGIVFTSYREGTGTAPQPGDWGGIGVAPTTNGMTLLEYVEIRYAGGGPGFLYFKGRGGLYTETSNLTVRNSSITQSGSSGLYVAFFAQPTVSENLFTDNLGCAVTIAPADSSATSLQGNVAAGNGVNAICVDGDLTQKITWATTDLPYVIGKVTIQPGASLTIDPGVTVRGGGQILVYGDLQARGTATQKVILSSFGGIGFADSSTGVLENVEIRGVGGTSFFGASVSAAVYTASSAVGISSNLFADSPGGGLAVAGSASPLVTGNTFSRNGGGLVVTDSASPLVTHNAFTENSGCAITLVTGDASGSVIQDNTAVGNGTDGICLQGGILTVSRSWASTNFPYVLAQSFIVQTGATLTVDPGVVVKVPALRRIQVFGALRAQGQSDRKITFTSYRDGAVVPAQPGDWVGIAFGAGAAGLIENAQVKYAGGFLAPEALTAVYIASPGVTFRRSTIAYSAGDALFFSGGTFPEISDNVISGNSRCAIHLVNNSSGTPTRGNLASGNGSDGICVEGNLTVPLSWDSTDLPYFLNGHVTVKAGASLTISPDVVVKGNGTQIFVSGTLRAAGTPDHRIVFTSYREGTGVSPQPADWGGIGFDASAAGMLQNVDVRFGGACCGYFGSGIPTSVHLASPNVAIADVTIARSGSDGLLVTGGIAPRLARTRFIQNDTGLDFRNGAGGSVADSTFVSNRTAVSVDTTSLPVLGIIDDPDPLRAGKNNLVCNTLSVCSANLSRTIAAQNNWWGNAGPSGFCSGPVDADHALSGEAQPVLTGLKADLVNAGANLRLTWEDIAPACDYEVLRSPRPDAPVVSSCGACSGDCFCDISGRLAVPTFTEVVPAPCDLGACAPTDRYCCASFYSVVVP